ncbi:MAG: hypothetical protein ACR2QE_14970 [Acidimicrobiales bacterium]
MTQVFRRLAALLMVVVLVAAACTTTESDDEASTEDSGTATTASGDDGATETTASGDDGATETTAGGDATDTAAGGELTASFPGVTEDSIVVGISMLDFASLVSDGLSPQGWGDQQAVWEALVADLNDRGGINGRTVEATYGFYSPVNEEEAFAICSQLTEDIESFAVLGGFLGPVEDVSTCITGANSTILVGGRTNAERLAQSNATWIETNSSRTRRMAVLFDLLEENGNLTADSKVAIVAGNDTQTEAEEAAQLLRDRGIEPVSELSNTAAEGDVTAGSAEWAVLSERIETDGADTVLLVGATTSGIRGIRDNGLDVEIWAIDNDALTALGESVTSEEADGVLTATGLTDDQRWELESNQPCIEVVSTIPEADLRLPSDYEEGEEEWWRSTMAYCRWLAMFEKIATEAGVDLTQDSFQAAVENAGAFELPGVPFASLGLDKYDAEDTFVLSVWNASLGENGELEAITEPISAGGVG